MADLDTLLRDEVRGSAHEYRPGRRALPDVGRSPLPPLALVVALMLVVGGVAYGAGRVPRAGWERITVTGDDTDGSGPPAGGRADGDHGALTLHS